MRRTKEADGRGSGRGDESCPAGKERLWWKEAMWGAAERGASGPLKKWGYTREE